MSFEPAALLIVALAMLLCGFACQSGPHRPTSGTLEEAVIASLGSFLQQMAFVCAVAAVLVWMAPWWRAWPLEHRTLSTLNNDIQSLSKLLEMLWMWPAFAAAVAIGTICLGLGNFAEAAVYHLRWPLRWSLRLQLSAALVALVGLTGVTADRNITRIIDESTAKIDQINQLRITLAKRASDSALAALTIEMVQELPEDIGLTNTAADYWAAAPYFEFPKPLRYDISRNFADSQAVARQAPDSDLTTLQEKLKKAEFRRNGESPIDAASDVIAMLLDAGIDQTVLKALKAAYLPLDHPLLNELLGALTDPVLTEPLRISVIGIAVATMHSEQGPQFLREQAKRAWQDLPPAARERWSLVGTRVRSAMVASPFIARVALGNPRWQGVHEEFERSEPWSSKPLSLQKGWRYMAKIHIAIDRLTVDNDARRSIADIAWGRALLQGYRIDDSQRDQIRAAWGRTLASRMNLPNVNGEPNARAGLVAWYGAQPKREADRAIIVLGQTGPSNAIPERKPERKSDGSSEPRPPIRPTPKPRLAP